MYSTYVVAWNLSRVVALVFFLPGRTLGLFGMEEHGVCDKVPEAGAEPPG